MALKLAVMAAISGVYTGANDLTSLQQTFDASKKLQLATGTGADQADLAFADTRTLSASASETLDLAGGLTNAFGGALTFAEVVAVLIVAAAGNTNDVVVGGAASNAVTSLFGDATDTVKIKPGGMFLLAAPGAAAYAVTAATADLLQVANGGSGTSVSYDVYIVGRTA